MIVMTLSSFTDVAGVIARIEREGWPDQFAVSDEVLAKMSAAKVIETINESVHTFLGRQIGPLKKNSIEATPVLERAENSHRPTHVFLHSFEYSQRQVLGTAKFDRGTAKVSVQRQFLDAAYAPVWCDVWIPCYVHDTMPRTGLWDVLGFWKENASIVA